MARGRKSKSKGKAPPPDYASPTPEQLGHGEYRQGGNLATSIDERAGLAFRRVPVIVTLASTGKLTERQFNGLARYRDIGIKCERSPIRDSCDFSVRGNGEGMPPSVVRAMREFDWLERELGTLQPIAYAVAIDDVTLSQWAIRQGGSTIRKRDLGGVVVQWIEPQRYLHKIALADIRMAGERLAAAIGV